jgi:hypothetical protein
MSDSDNENVQQKVTKTFRNDVLTWVNIDDSIRTVRAKVKELTQEKKAFEEKILTYLSQVEEESIVIKDGKLSKNVSKTKAPLKKETIYQSLVQLVGDATKANAMTEHIINSRPDIQRVNLKRTKIKAKVDKKTKE